MLNQVSLLGRMTVTPEVQRTGSGIPYCRFRLAVSRDYTDPDGNRGTDFINCIAWHQTAEFLAKHFEKGQLAAVSGRLGSSNWESDGQKRYKMEVVADSIYFAGANLSKAQEGSDEPCGDPCQDGYGILPGEDGQLPF